MNFTNEIIKKLKIKEKVRIKFCINDMGKITDIKSNSKNSKLNKKIIKVFQKSPDMQAAKSNGNSILSRFVVPVLLQVFDEFKFILRK